MPATVCPGPMAWKWGVLMAVMIGTGPDKGSIRAATRLVMSVFQTGSFCAEVPGGTGDRW